MHPSNEMKHPRPPSHQNLSMKKASGWVFWPLALQPPLWMLHHSNGLVLVWWWSRMFHPIWWVHLLWRYLHFLHFLDYFQFLKIFQFLYLLLHYLPFWLRVLHCHIVVPLDKDLLLVQINHMRNMIVMGENGLRTIMVINKTSMVIIHSVNGSWGQQLVVSLHLDVRRGRIFLAWNTPSSSFLPIVLYGWHYIPTTSLSNMDRTGRPRGKWFNGLVLLS